jgi:serine/threonine protein phosphatase PrpC
MTEEASGTVPGRERHRPFSVRAAGRTHVGLVRGNNEDSYYIGEHLLVVADGIGGAVAGELASQTLVGVFAAVEKADDITDLYETLADSVAQSSQEIRGLVRIDPDLAGMGTTATAMMWSAERIVFAHVGDSRAYYLQRGGHQPMRQITRDDSFVQYLLDTGVITAEEAVRHPRRNVILKAVNGMSVTPSFSTFAPLTGDRYLLCSDGLSDYVDDAAIENVLATVSDRHQATAALIALTLETGARDNVTVIVADVVPGDTV